MLIYFECYCMYFFICIYIICLSTSECCQKKINRYISEDFNSEKESKISITKATKVTKNYDLINYWNVQVLFMNYILYYIIIFVFIWKNIKNVSTQLADWFLSCSLYLFIDSFLIVPAQHFNLLVNYNWYNVLLLCKISVKYFLESWFFYLQINICWKKK